MTKKKEAREKPQLSILALISFVASFVVARTFTILLPDIVLESGGYHIHHFWFGIALLAIGGWLGISYDSERVSRLAAILYGAGGGLIGDEIGLLLTLGNYESELTFTAIILILTFASIFILISRYRALIYREFTEFARTNASLYIGVFVAVVSVAFILETNNMLIIAVSGSLTILACAVIVAYFVLRIRSRRS